MVQEKQLYLQQRDSLEADLCSKAERCELLEEGESSCALAQNMSWGRKFISGKIMSKKYVDPLTNLDSLLQLWIPSKTGWTNSRYVNRDYFSLTVSRLMFLLLEVMHDHCLYAELLPHICRQGWRRFTETSTHLWPCMNPLLRQSAARRAQSPHARFQNPRTARKRAEHHWRPGWICPQSWPRKRQALFDLTAHCWCQSLIKCRQCEEFILYLHCYGH